MDELTLIEELHAAASVLSESHRVCMSAADRIAELEELQDKCEELSRLQSQLDALVGAVDAAVFEWHRDVWVGEKCHMHDRMSELEATRAQIGESDE